MKVFEKSKNYIFQNTSSGMQWFILHLRQDILVHRFNPSTVLLENLPIAVLDAFLHLINIIPLSAVCSASITGNDLAPQKIQPRLTAVQMHYIQGHYVVSHQNQRIITIYDSLPSAQRVQQVVPQLMCHCMHHSHWCHNLLWSTLFASYRVTLLTVDCLLMRMNCSEWEQSTAMDLCAA